MQRLLGRPLACASSLLLSALAACGGQTLSSSPADSGPADARPDSASVTVVDDASQELDVSLPTGSCLSVCKGKAAACGAPSGAAAMDCEVMCATSPTAAQLACIEAGNCANLAASFEDAGTVCGIGQPDGG